MAFSLGLHFFISPRLHYGRGIGATHVLLSTIHQTVGLVGALLIRYAM
jgi:hypothetical protein